MTSDPAFLAAVPRRLLVWEEDDAGHIVLLRPQLGGGPWGRWIASLLHLRDYRIRLDPIGSLVWRHCDGQRPVSQILQILRTEFGDQIEPAEPRLKKYLDKMSHSRMITFG